MADLVPPFHEGYGLWLMAEDSHQKILQEQINRLAAEYGGDQFLGHATVVGLTDRKQAELPNLKEKTQQLVEEVKKFEVEAIGLGARNMYFQSLFLILVPSAPVVTLNAKARTLFGRESDPPYMPHISLMYGNFDWTTKQRAVKSTDFSFPMMLKIGSVVLVDSSGYPNEWKIIEEYPLK